jgi:hypothetical protein
MHGKDHCTSSCIGAYTQYHCCVRIPLSMCALYMHMLNNGVLTVTIATSKLQASYKHALLYVTLSESTYRYSIKMSRYCMLV